MSIFLNLAMKHENAILVYEYEPQNWYMLHVYPTSR
jgi:hypothetical protein